MSKQDTVPGTPGPWLKRPGSLAIRAGKRLICRAEHAPGTYRAEATINRDLIAAAPALYNKLRVLAQMCASPWDATEDMMLRESEEVAELLQTIDPEMRPWPMRDEP